MTAKAANLAPDRGPGPVPTRWLRSILLHALLVVLAVVCFAPFVWLVCATLKRNEDFFSYLFLPTDSSRGILWDRLTADNFRQLFVNKPFGAWLINSLFLSSLHTAIVVVLSSLGGFALAKYRFRGRGALMAAMLVTMILPSQVLLPSSWLLMHQIGWLDSYWAILVPGAVSVFGMFLFMQSMKAVPNELLQAGRVDGCSELRLWWEVALPIVRPMIGAYTLLAFLASWNSFLWPQVVLQSPGMFTLPIGLSNLIGLPADDTPYGMLMAGTLLSILPIMILFFVLQRDFISGLASGAVKG